MEDERRITYLRISLDHLVDLYRKETMRKGVRVIGASYDARKNDVIIEIILAKEGVPMR